MKSFEEMYKDLNNNTELSKIEKKIKEESKKEKRLNLIIGLIVNSIIIFFYIYLKAYNNFIMNMIFIIVGLMVNLIVLVTTTTIFNKAIQEYTPIFKEQFVKNLINNFFDDVEYFSTKEMPEKIYNEGLYEDYDNYVSDDYIEAKIDNKYFIDIAEVETEEEKEVKNSKGDMETETSIVFSRNFCKNCNG